MLKLGCCSILPAVRLFSMKLIVKPQRVSLTQRNFFFPVPQLWQNMAVFIIQMWAVSRNLCASGELANISMRCSFLQPLARLFLRVFFSRQTMPLRYGNHSCWGQLNLVFWFPLSPTPLRLCSPLILPGSGQDKSPGHVMVGSLWHHMKALESVGDWNVACSHQPLSSRHTFKANSGPPRLPTC